MAGPRGRWRPNRAPITVLDIGDPRAAVAFGGLSYSVRPADVGTGVEPFLVLEVGEVTSYDSELRRLVVPLHRTALDRRGVVAAPRPVSAPEASRRLSEVMGARHLRSWPTTDRAFSAWRGIVEGLAGTRLVEFDDHTIDPISQAQAAVHLAASGVLVKANDQHHPALAAIEPELAAEIVDPAGRASDGDLEWAAAVARQARRAWLGHSLRLQWSANGRDVGIAPRPLPGVSVILVSRRPGLVEMALRRVRRQVGVDVEVIVALHHHSASAVRATTAMLGDLSLDGDVLAVDPQVPFGAAVNLAVERSTNPVVTKWDDDDLYGPHHLQDLLVAMRRSGADMVGKAAEFVVFTEFDETIHRSFEGAESDSTYIAGGTMTMTRTAFDEADGFPPISRSIDHHLKQRFLDLGLRVYRTHGFGFALVRGHDDHTWSVAASVLRRTGDRRFVGIPELADLGEDL